jgi:hypothetical protein
MYACLISPYVCMFNTARTIIKARTIIIKLSLPGPPPLFVHCVSFEQAFLLLVLAALGLNKPSSSSSNKTPPPPKNFPPPPPPPPG